MLKSPTASEKNTKARRAWREVHGGWQHLYGSFERDGISVERHDFSSAVPLDWAASFRPNSIEICINATGTGQLGSGADAFQIRPQSMAAYIADPEITAMRSEGERHRFLTFELSLEYLQLFLQGNEHQLREPVRNFLAGKKPAGVGLIHAANKNLSDLYGSLISPPVGASAHGLFYQSRLLDFAAEMFFSYEDAEPFCERHRRVAADRVVQVKKILLEDLSVNHSLDELAKKVACSPSYLSRTFSKEVGMTVPQFLKNERIEKACELLRSGKFNVSETAAEVGYASLSHFSKIFYEVTGCCPGLYPNSKLFPSRARLSSKNTDAN